MIKRYYSFPFYFLFGFFLFTLQAGWDFASTLVTTLQSAWEHSKSSLSEAELCFSLQSLITDTSQKNSLPSGAETWVQKSSLIPALSNLFFFFFFFTPGETVLCSELAKSCAYLFWSLISGHTVQTHLTGQ